MEFCITHLYKKCSCVFKIKLKKVLEIKQSFEKNKTISEKRDRNDKIDYNLDPSVKKIVLYFEKWMVEKKNKILSE